MTNTRDAEASRNAAIDAAILAVLEDGEWMPYLLVRWTLEAVPNLVGVPNRIHALERRGLIESRIWGQGNERQLWLRRTKEEQWVYETSRVS